MGRACIYTVYRWWYGWRSSWPEWPASFPLLYYRWWLYDPFFWGWCYWYRPDEDREKRSSPSGKNAAGRYSRRQDDQRWRAEAAICRKESIWWMAGFQSGRVRRPESAKPGCSCTCQRTAPPFTEDLWLYLRTVPHHDPSNGIKWSRSSISHGCWFSFSSAF